MYYCHSVHLRDIFLTIVSFVLTLLCGMMSTPFVHSSNVTPATFFHGTQTRSTRPNSLRFSLYSPLLCKELSPTSLQAIASPMGQLCKYTRNQMCWGILQVATLKSSTIYILARVQENQKQRKNSFIPWYFFLFRAPTRVHNVHGPNAFLWNIVFELRIFP